MKFKTGEHLCALLSNEKDFQDVIIPFICEGLFYDQKVIYITNSRTSDVIIDYLEDSGVKTDGYIAKGQLVFLTANDTYLREYSFTPQSMLELLKQETQRAVSEGYTALRGTGEMSWAAQKPLNASSLSSKHEQILMNWLQSPVPGSERLIEYEYLLNEFFPKNKISVICQYDIDRFEADTLISVLQTHPKVIIGSKLCNNRYYISPQELRNKRLPEAMLERYLDNIKAESL
ncbi:MAG: MEDS domain-containing protein [Fibrobacteria bacterium]|nr:MEDS domain-containing protein [Fibrobacteria bacterium]